MKIPFIILATIILVGCAPSVVDEPAEVLDEVSEPQDANPTVVLEESTEIEETEDVEEVSDETTADSFAEAPFVFTRILSYGSYDASSFQKYRHDYLTLELVAKEPVDLRDVRFQTVAKGVEYNGSYHEDSTCDQRDLIIDRRRERFAVEEDFPRVLERGEVSKFCVPTPITMVRNEMFVWNVTLNDQSIYQVFVDYPDNLRDLVVEFDTDIAVPVN